MKRCSNCGQNKELIDFHLDKSRRDGHAYICKICLNRMKTPNPIPRVPPGICSMCKVNKAVSRRNKICPECHRNYEKIRYHKNPEFYRALKNAWYTKHRKEMQRSERERRWKTKLACIQAYGGRCKCCGEANPIFLSLDHINNDGKQDRKLYGCGTPFYQRLRIMGFPKGRLQVLCYNCNMAKAFFKTCPHATSSPEQAAA